MELMQVRMLLELQQTVVPWRRRRLCKTFLWLVSWDLVVLWGLLYPTDCKPGQPKPLAWWTGFQDRPWPGLSSQPHERLSRKRTTSSVPAWAEEQDRGQSPGFHISGTTEQTNKQTELGSLECTVPRCQELTERLNGTCHQKA